MKLNDRLFGLVVLVLSMAYGWGATRFPEPFGGTETVGPETFPIILSVVLVLSSLYLMFRPDEEQRWPLGKTAMDILMAIVVLVIYTMLLEPLGFILATTLTVGTLSWRMGAHPTRAYFTGLTGGIVVFLIFNYALDLALPLGVMDLERAS